MGRNPIELEDDEIRPLRRSEMEILKGGAQPGPSALPLPSRPDPLPQPRPQDRRTRR